MRNIFVIFLILDFEIFQALINFEFCLFSPQRQHVWPKLSNKNGTEIKKKGRRPNRPR